MLWGALNGQMKRPNGKAPPPESFEAQVTARLIKRQAWGRRPLCAGIKPQAFQPER